MNNTYWEDGQLVDIHTHILPGVDDGADDWETALAMLRMAEDDGIGELACTPHQSCVGEIVNSNSHIVDLVQKLQERAYAAGLHIRLYPAGEVRCTMDVIERLEKGMAATFGVAANGAIAPREATPREAMPSGATPNETTITPNETETQANKKQASKHRYMLLEMPFDRIPPFAHQVVYELLVRGITPVIAHPERNEDFARQPELLAELVMAGALAQITAASLSRLANTRIRETSALFISHNLVHFIASDAHSPHKRPPMIGRYAKKVAAIWGQEKALAMASQAPGALLHGEAVVKEAPCAFSRSSRRQAIIAARALASGSTRRGGLWWPKLRGVR